MGPITPFVFQLVLLLSVLSLELAVEDRKAHIIYMGSLPQGKHLLSHHSKMVAEAVHPSFVNNSLIRSFTRSFNGFAAYLTEEERKKMASLDGILSVFPSQSLRLHTTRSWDFMGFPETVQRNPTVESDTIIGVIDSGVWPESKSFQDEGIGSIPSKWKGECAGGDNFSCNKKIIGARWYNLEDKEYSARDKDGHGTITASIAAGIRVTSASFYGLAWGTARGGVPSARIAVYKACSQTYCNAVDIMTAFDDAIADGVDIISISVGANSPVEFSSDPVAIGAFHAIERGVLTVNSAGNFNRKLFSVVGAAPWILSVAASNIDRRITDSVVLGDGTALMGSTINAFPSNEQEVALLYGKETTSTCSEVDARNCLAGCLDGKLVKRKVVLCDSHFGTKEAQTVGALGAIIRGGSGNVSDVQPLPTAALSKSDISFVQTYISSSRMPTARILRSETISNITSPVVAPFSASGPNSILPDILKPDITAPGVEILAAFSPIASPSGIPSDLRSVNYSIESGTSMACPHVAAAAAYVKSFHPDWTPSALRSALMTTASEMDPMGNLDAEFAYGSGHLNPLRAKDPGLVYETSIDDYMKIWCPTRNSSKCQENIASKDLNYPSMAVQIHNRSSFSITFQRSVTNVGRQNSTYTYTMKGSRRLKFSVEPSSLQFTALKQKKTFVVTVKGKGIKSPLTIESASLVWTDGFYVVRSPIVVYTGTVISSCGGGPPTPLSFCLTFVLVFFLL